MFYTKKKKEKMNKYIDDLRQKVCEHEKSIVYLKFVVENISKFNPGDCVKIKDGSKFNKTSDYAGPYKIISKEPAPYYCIPPYLFEWRYECINDKFKKINLLETELELN